MLLLYPSSDLAHHTVIHKSLQQCSSVHAPLLAIPAHSGCWQHTQRCYSSTPPMHSFGPSISILDGGCPAHTAALLSLPTSHSTDGSPHHPAFQSSPLCFAPAGTAFLCKKQIRFPRQGLNCGAPPPADQSVCIISHCRGLRAAGWQQKGPPAPRTAPAHPLQGLFVLKPLIRNELHPAGQLKGATMPFQHPLPCPLMYTEE